LVDRPREQFAVPNEAMRADSSIAATNALTKARTYRDRRVAVTCGAAITLAIAGVFGTWRNAGPVSVDGFEGPHNGWLVIIFALIALAGVAPLSRGSWLGFVTVLGSACVMLFTAVENIVDDGEVLGGSSGWGAWLTVAASAVLTGAALFVAVQRVRVIGWRPVVSPARVESASETPTAAGQGWRARSSRGVKRWWRPVLAAVGILFAAFFFVVSRQVLAIVQKPSWPPGPTAITSATAQLATEGFVAHGDVSPADVGVPYAWSTAATIEPWPEGKNFFPRIFADIEKARSSVHILMFGWREGTVGTELTDLLLRKLQEGVEVRIILDSQGTKPYGPTKPMFTRLADAGAQIVVNDVLPWDEDGLYPDHLTFDWTQDDVGRADHRKLYAIDGTVAWIGGAGVEDHFENGQFHDVMVRVTGNVVRQAQALFLMSFRAHGGPLPDNLSKYFPAQPQPGRIPIAILQTVPGGFTSADQAISALIDRARTRLDIMNPYFTDVAMIQRVIAAAKRGVKVRIVVSQTSNNPQAAAALKYHYSDLIHAGVQIWEYPGAVVHAKLVVADNTVVFGTVNFDAWSLYRNYEVAMMARGAAVANVFEERVFNPDIARSQPGKPPGGIISWAKGWFWNKLAYFL
jgi:cardiolipin synthase